MKIESLAGAHKPENSPAIQSLESRLLQASQELPDSKRPNPEFDWLYQQLLSMEGRGEKDIYAFIRAQRSADGVTPAYPTAKALMAVTLQVLVRMKEEKLEGSLLFKEVRGANGLAFSMDVFVKGFMRDVFATMDDDAWEKSEW
jgi:hypothetical protein